MHRGDQQYRHRNIEHCNATSFGKELTQTMARHCPKGQWRGDVHRSEYQHQQYKLRERRVGSTIRNGNNQRHRLGFGIDELQTCCLEKSELFIRFPGRVCSQRTAVGDFPCQTENIRSGLWKIFSPSFCAMLSKWTRGSCRLQRPTRSEIGTVPRRFTQILSTSGLSTSLQTVRGLPTRFFLNALIRLLEWVRLPISRNGE